MHFEGVLLKDISEAKIYAAVSRMTNRKAKERWEQRAVSMAKKGLDIGEYKPAAVSPSTKAKHLALMKAMMRAAEREWKWIEKSPVIKVPQKRNKRVRWFEPAEAKRLIDECPEPLKSAVEFALETGLRRSNIVDLKWQQIDLQRKVAWIYPEESKSGRAIGVALNDLAESVLRRQIGRHHNWVFVHTESVKRNDGTTERLPQASGRCGSIQTLRGAQY